MMDSKLQDILDLLRTGSAPDAFGMTEQQWLQHKVNKACAELQEIGDEIDRLREALSDANHIIMQHGTPIMKAHASRIMNINRAVEAWRKD